MPTVKYGKCFAEFGILIALLKLQGPCQEVGLLIKILSTYNIQFKFFDDHISGHPLSRKHSDLDLGRFNFVRWHHTSGSFPGGGARGRN